MADDIETNHDYRIPRELAALRPTSDGRGYYVSLDRTLEEAGFEHGDEVEVVLDLAESPPMFMIGPAPDDADFTAGEVRTVGQKIFLPKDDLETMGLDLRVYETENPFLFEPIVLEDMVALHPLGFASDVLGEDLDDQVEALPQDALRAGSQATGVAIEDLAAVCRQLEETVARDQLAGQTVDEYPPVQRDGREILFVAPDAWTAIVSDVVEDQAVVEAVEIAMTSAARAVVSDDRSYRRFEEDVTPFVRPVE